MKHLMRGYALLLAGLACLAAALMAVMAASVVFDVTVRTLGMQPPAWTVPLSEYLLLYITLLAAPWVLRQKGHVVVDSLLGILPPLGRRLAAWFVYGACAVACLVIAWAAASATWGAWTAGAADVRAVMVPKYLLSLPFVPAFGLMAVEFLRFLAGRDSLYEGAATQSVA